MNKNSFNDIVPGKRSIRDVSLPSRRRPIPPAATNLSPEEPQETTYDFEYNLDRGKKKKSKRGWLWALLIIFVGALAFGVSSLFAEAVVTVTPKSQSVPTDVTLTALANQPAGTFGYQVVSVSTTTGETVAATGQANVSTKASGTIMIYNSGSQPENLVANTRFATPDGLVYRISAAVKVPAATVTSGQTTPGSASATVTADQAGASYNIGLSDFTLPGLSGTPEAQIVYGRSQTPMTGGASGLQSVVASTTVAQSQADLESSLKTALQNQIADQIPSNFVLYPASITFTFSGANQSGGTAGQATLSETGTASALIFDKTLLSQAIITALGNQISNPPADLSQAEVSNLNDLTFALQNPKSITANESDTITLQISGDAQIIWLFDQHALSNDLIGLKKSNLDALLEAKYPTIQSAQASIKPFWKQTFPSNPSKITIIGAQQ